MTQTEALKLALEALTHLQPTALTSFYTIGDRDKAITAVKEALAQPEQEPVAWMGTDVDGNPNKFRLNFFGGAIPLFVRNEDRTTIADNEKDGSLCPEFWDWLPRAYNFDGDGVFTKYNMEVAFLAGKQSVAINDTSKERVDETAKQRHEQEPVAWINWCAATGKRTVSFECESELASQPLYEGITQNTQYHYSKFHSWFDSELHRQKYTKDHPAYLAAQEAWNAANDAAQHRINRLNAEIEAWKVRFKIAEDALAKLNGPEQKPVATMWQHGETGRTRITIPGDITDCDARWFKAADLYTSPPQHKRLLASDIVTMYDENPRSDSEMIEFARAIEAAHGIKGET